MSWLGVMKLYVLLRMVLQECGHTWKDWVLVHLANVCVVRGDVVGTLALCDIVRMSQVACLIVAHILNNLAITFIIIV
jgi:hypothetical protein